MFCMVTAMYYYMQYFGADNDGDETDESPKAKPSGKEEGVMEGNFVQFSLSLMKY